MEGVANLLFWEHLVRDFAGRSLKYLLPRSIAKFRFCYIDWFVYICYEYKLRWSWLIIATNFINIQ